jgi:hypothetical protein
MRILFTIMLCLAMTVSALAADRDVNITPLKGPVLSIDQTTPRSVCIYGHDAAAAYAITDYIWGQESYATVFNAAQPVCACTSGFTIEQVHFYMNFRVEDVPSTFDASVEFRENAIDVTTGCSVPGPVICESPLYTVNITNPGLYDIALPMTAGAGACAYFGYDYAVSINFPNAFPPTQRPDAVTDGAPVGCVSYNNYDAGWLDTVSLGFPGELVMYADVICCEPPVPSDEPSWGELKSLYR